MFTSIIPRAIGPFSQFSLRFVNLFAHNPAFAPARVPSASRAAVREAGRTLFRALGCRGLARIDFFVTDDGGIVFNEINTMPGFTDISMYPMLLSRLGLTLGGVVDILLKNAKK